MSDTTLSLSPALAGPSERAPAAGPDATALVRPLLTGGLGTAAVGALIALGGGELDTALSAAALWPLVPLGAGGLTSPTLVVGSMFVDLHLGAADALSAVARGAARTGEVLTGLVPFVALFALTTSWGPGLAVALTGLAGAMGLATSVAHLIHTERALLPPDAPRRHHARVVGLAAGWAVLTALVGLRLLVHVLDALWL